MITLLTLFIVFLIFLFIGLCYIGGFILIFIDPIIAILIISLTCKVIKKLKAKKQEEIN